MAGVKPEAKVSKAVKELFDQLGGARYTLEQGYRSAKGGTRQTPGLPDLIVFFRGWVLFWELKAPGKYPTPSQRAFAQEVRHCQAYGTGIDTAVIRSAEDAWDRLRELGLIEAAGG